MNTQPNPNKANTSPDFNQNLIILNESINKLNDLLVKNSVVKTPKPIVAGKQQDVSTNSINDNRTPIMGNSFFKNMETFFKRTATTTMSYTMSKTGDYISGLSNVTSSVMTTLFGRILDDFRPIIDIMKLTSKFMFDMVIKPLSKLTFSIVKLPFSMITSFFTKDRQTDKLTKQVLKSNDSLKGILNENEKQTEASKERTVLNESMLDVISLQTKLLKKISSCSCNNEEDKEDKEKTSIFAKIPKSIATSMKGVFSKIQQIPVIGSMIKVMSLIPNVMKNAFTAIMTPIKSGFSFISKGIMSIGSVIGGGISTIGNLASLIPFVGPLVGPLLKILLPLAIGAFGLKLLGGTFSGLIEEFKKIFPEQAKAIKDFIDNDVKPMIDKTMTYIGDSFKKYIIDPILVKLGLKGKELTKEDKGVVNQLLREKFGSDLERLQSLVNKQNLTAREKWEKREYLRHKAFLEDKLANEGSIFYSKTSKETDYIKDSLKGAGLFLFDTVKELIQPKKTGVPKATDKDVYGSQVNSQPSFNVKTGEEVIKNNMKNDPMVRNVIPNELSETDKTILTQIAYRESRIRDIPSDAKREGTNIPISSGVFQFTEATWKKAASALGISTSTGISDDGKSYDPSKDARLNRELNVKAMEYMLNDYKKSLSIMKEDYNYKNVRILHWFGESVGKKIIKLAKTNPNAAIPLNQKALKDNNLVGVTVGGLIKRIDEQGDIGDIKDKMPSLFENMLNYTKKATGFIGEKASDAAKTASDAAKTASDAAKSATDSAKDGFTDFFTFMKDMFSDVTDSIMNLTSDDLRYITAYTQSERGSEAIVSADKELAMKKAEVNSDIENKPEQTQQINSIVNGGTSVVTQTPQVQRHRQSDIQSTIGPMFALNIMNSNEV